MIFLMRITIRFVFPALFFYYTVYAVVPTLWYKYQRQNDYYDGRKNKEILLTFDDGPNPAYTKTLLDILERENVKATFFLVADRIAENEDIVRRMVEEGHTVALHSYAHKRVWLKNPLFVRREFRRSLAIFKELDIRIEYYRPPWGCLNLSILNEIRRNHLKLLLWSVIVGDWEEDTSAEILEDRLMNSITGGSIVLLHDSGCDRRAYRYAPERTLEAVSSVIPKLKRDGYTFYNLKEKQYERERNQKAN